MYLKTESITVQTYAEALQNLKNDKTSSGFNIPDVLRDDYRRTDSYLENILTNELVIAKEYAAKGQNRADTNDNELKILEKNIKSLRNIIGDAIINLSVDELLDFSIQSGRGYKYSILSHLAVMGEVNLFINTFKKLKHQLTDKDLIELYKNLLWAYEGNWLTESLYLASSLLKRGDTCFIAMAEWILNEKVNDNQWLEQCADVGVYSPRPDDVYSLDKFKQDSSRNPKEAEQLYDKFVTQHKGEHLFVQLMQSFIKDPNNFTNFSKDINFNYKDSRKHQFFSGEPNTTKSWDFNNPTLGMLIFAACIPVIGWAYLAYLLISYLCSDNNEQKASPNLS